jgi:hypothetical protein
MRGAGKCQQKGDDDYCGCSPHPLPPRDFLAAEQSERRAMHAAIAGNEDASI